MSTPCQTAASLSLGKLLAKAADADGDARSVTAAGPASAQGGTAVLQGGSILYTPPGPRCSPASPASIPYGTWTLFVADQSAGETSTLQSWTLTVTAVLEPSAALRVGLGELLLLRRRRASSC